MKNLYTAWFKMDDDLEAQFREKFKIDPPLYGIPVVEETAEKALESARKSKPQNNFVKVTESKMTVEEWEKHLVEVQREIEQHKLTE